MRRAALGVAPRTVLRRNARTPGRRGIREPFSNALGIFRHPSSHAGSVAVRRRSSLATVPVFAAFARRWQGLRGLFDRVELFNGRQLFGWVAEAGLPGVACGDLHRAEQLPGWTTLVPCERDEQALVDYLRSPRPVFLTRLRAAPRCARCVAARALTRWCSVAPTRKRARSASEPLPRRVQPSSRTPPLHVRIIDRDGTASRRAAKGRESRCAGRGRLGVGAAS